MNTIDGLTEKERENLIESNIKKSTIYPALVIASIECDNIEVEPFIIKKENEAEVFKLAQQLKNEWSNDLTVLKKKFGTTDFADVFFTRLEKAHIDHSTQTCVLLLDD